MGRLTEGKKQGKAYQASKALRGANRRLLAESQRAIRGFLNTYELEYWYYYDSRVLYTYCYQGNELYFSVETICFN